MKMNLFERMFNEVIQFCIVLSVIVAVGFCLDVALDEVFGLLHLF